MMNQIQEVQEGAKPKKKRRNVQTWKKTVVKKQRNSGEGYVSPKTKTVKQPKTLPTEVNIIK